MKRLVILAVACILTVACGSDSRLFKQARLATSKGKLTEAVSLYSRLIKQDPKNFAAYVNRGVLWEQLPVKDAKERLSNRQKAEEDYLKAIELNPNSAETYNNLGALYLDMNRNMDAAYYLSTALSLDPKYFTARMNRAIVYHRMGRISDALSDFDKAAALRPKDPLLLLNRALSYYELGQYESAASDLSLLIFFKPDDARAYLERAKAFIKMGYPANAYADLEEAVTIKPTYALAYYYMGDLMFRKGEKEQALGLLVKSKELASQDVPTYELMGDMLAMEDPVAATANYMVARKLDPANARRYEAKIRLMRSEEGRERVLANRFFPQALQQQKR